MSAEGGARPPLAMHPNALPVGTKLGEFEIVEVIGEGGFGIVYLAVDHSLDRKVAIKEYMPTQLAARGHDASVSVRSTRHQETFDLGLRSFVNEARLLARFEHPALIKVYRFWEGNGTAYMAMPFLVGRTLQDALKARPAPPDEAWIRKLLAPIMDALAVLHEDRIYHRDVAPDNIMLLAGDRPVLLDFGAARRVISDTTHSLTVILKPGYAPIEQYADKGGMKQGPWTDVYALGAVVYFMILGRKPPAAVSRMMEDSYEPLVRSEAVGRYSAQLLEGIDRCLAVKPQDRPQSIAAMGEAIGADPLPTIVQAPAHEEPTLIVSSPARAVSVAAPRPEAEPELEATVRYEFHESAPAPPIRPPASSSKVPMLTVGGLLGLGVIALAVAWYAARGTSPAAVTADTAVAAASAPAAPPSAVVVPATPPPPAPPRIDTLASAIEAAASAADPGLSVAVQAPASAPLGSPLKLSVHSGSDGTLYLFAWDQAADKVHRLMSGEKPGGTPIKPNDTVALTYDDTATRAAKDQPGNWRVVSMLSEKPRDFSSSVFERAGAAGVIDRSALESQLATNGLPSLFGTVPCAAGASCADRYAISVIDVAREAAAPERVAERAPRAKVAKSASADAAQRKKGSESEREYMKKFDKNLDNLLGK